MIAPGILRTLASSPDARLAAVLAVAAASILAKAYFDPNGYVSPDSASYLALAQQLVAGAGFAVTDERGDGVAEVFFATWPVGYPILIACVAAITTLSVFWASKLANILVMGACLLLFRRLFGADAAVFGLLFLSGAALEIFSFSWSEPPFIVTLFSFAASLAAVMSRERPHVGAVVLVALLSVLLFLFRYVGAFSVGVLLLLSLYCFWRGRPFAPRGVAFAGAALVAGTLMAAYLSHNLAANGHLTGIPRLPAPESHHELLYQLAKSLAAEALLPVATISPVWRGLLAVAIQVSLFAFLATRHAVPDMRRPAPDEDRNLIGSLVLVGGAYLVAIVALRWNSHFDGFSFRLLAPGSLVLLAALLAWLRQRLQPGDFAMWARGLAALAIASLLLQVAFPLLRNLGSPTYGETVEKISQRYRPVAPGSVVAFANLHALYLRPDLISLTPQPRQPHSSPEAWSDFLSRLRPDVPVYLDPPSGIAGAMPSEAVRVLHHPTIVELVRLAPEGSVKLVRQGRLP